MGRRDGVCLALVAAVFAGGVGAPVGGTAAAHAQAPKGDPRLRAFGSCDQLLGFFRAGALADWEERVRESQVPASGEPTGGGDLPARPEPATGEEPSADTGSDFSTTNVQEAGIDEPDMVKADGRHLFVLVDRRVRAVSARGGPPRLLGTVRVPGYGGDMLLYRGRLLVFSSDGGRVFPADGGRSRSGSLITEIDVRNPRAMRVTRTLAFDGYVVDARLHGPTARVVVSSYLEGPELPYFEEGQDPNVVLAQGRELITHSRVSDWMPSFTLRDARRGSRSSGLLVPCSEVLRGDNSDDDSDPVSVLTIDVRRGLPAVDVDAILMSYADVVYASRGGLYLASTVYGERESSTAIHKFAIGPRATTAYGASGLLAGTLIGQFALSEHRGFLRVASTESRYARNYRLTRRVSYVTVLRSRAERLQAVGRANLGQGALIDGVRFIEDVGYVATDRKFDPFYTVDLSRPARPRVVGELRLRGYSTYLHPVGRDRVLAVGHDIRGRERILGVQVSLFDVSDPRRPRRLDHARMGSDSYSEAEYDHHAFLYWPPRSLAVIPVEHDSPELGETLITEMVGVRVAGGRGLTEAGRVLHGAGVRNVAVRRSIVVGDRLFTVSDRGVGAADLATWQPRGYARFPTPPRQRERG